MHSIRTKTRGVDVCVFPSKDATSGSSRKHTTNDGCCSFFVCRKNLFFRFSSSFASLGLVCSLSTAFMTFYRFNSYRSDVAWMCVPGNTFTSRKFPDLYLLMPLSNFFSTTLDDTTCCFISARWYENQSMGNRDPYLIPNLYHVIEWAWKYAGATKFSLFCSELAVWKLLLITSCIPVWIPWRVELGRKPRSSVHETWICMVLINM